MTNIKEIRKCLINKQIKPFLWSNCDIVKCQLENMKTFKIGLLIVFTLKWSFMSMMIVIFEIQFSNSELYGWSKML